MADGYSLLLEDASYKPVVLNRNSEDARLSLKSYTLACEDWLARHTLMEGFTGEVSLVLDDLPMSLVPKDLYQKKEKESYLEPVARLKSTDSVKSRTVSRRPFKLVYGIPASIQEMAGKMAGKVRIIPSMEVLLSVADQVNASDHQRGFAIIDLQEGFLGILYIRNDLVILCNHMVVRETDEMIYHTLNSLHQVDFDRKNMPLFHIGSNFDEVEQTLKKYIRKVNPLTYKIPDLDLSLISEHIILAEATKCE